MNLQKYFYHPLIIIITILLSGCKYSDDSSNQSQYKDMVLVPAGEFMMGSSVAENDFFIDNFQDENKENYLNEQPRWGVILPAFYIDKYEVTNLKYKAFIDGTGRKPPVSWELNNFLQGNSLLPVIDVSWFDAFDYCKWVGKSLPNEPQWEKAAKGINHLRYPWGMDYIETNANLNTGQTEQVGTFKTDLSGYGVFDMAGNVMEWVDGWHVPYPDYKGNDKIFRGKEVVIRGGAAGLSGHYSRQYKFARTTNRMHIAPDTFGVDTGFRCAKSIDEQKEAITN